MKSRLLESLRLAIPRFLIGALGTWCTIGPIILLNGLGSVSSGVMAALLLLLLLCYAIVFTIFLRSSRREVLEELVSETALTLCFIIVGLLMNEMTGVFIAIKDEMAVVYAFIGFFLAESIKPKTPLKTLGETFAAVIYRRF